MLWYISCCNDMLGCFRITSIRNKINHLSEHSRTFWKLTCTPAAGAGSTHCAVHWAPPPDRLRSDVKSTFSPLFLPSRPCISSFTLCDWQNLLTKYNDGLFKICMMLSITYNLTHLFFPIIMTSPFLHFFLSLLLMLNLDLGQPNVNFLQPDPSL